MTIKELLKATRGDVDYNLNFMMKDIDDEECYSVPLQVDDIDTDVNFKNIFLKEDMQ